jgi:hypothetical protein
MKNIVMTAAITAMCVGKTHAQVPNSIFVMGTGAYENSSNYRIGNIGIGYQFDKNWTIGLMGGLSKISSYSKSNQFGAFARYTSYFGKSEHFFWFAQGQGLHYDISENNAGNSVFYKRTSLRISAITGMGIHFGKGYSLIATPIGMSYSIGLKDENNTGNNRNNISLGVNFSPEIAISKNISWKKRKPAPAKTETKE